MQKVLCGLMALVLFVTFAGCNSAPTTAAPANNASANTPSNAVPENTASVPTNEVTSNEVASNAVPTNAAPVAGSEPYMGTFALLPSKEMEAAAEEQVKAIEQTARAQGQTEDQIKASVASARDMVKQALASTKLVVQPGGTFVMTSMGTSLNGSFLAKGDEITFSPDPNSVKNQQASDMLKSQQPFVMKWDATKQTLTGQEGSVEMVFKKS